jgi:hypothetical protein
MKFQSWEQTSPWEWARKTDEGGVVARVSSEEERSEDVPQRWRWSVGALREWADSEEGAKRLRTRSCISSFTSPNRSWESSGCLDGSFAARSIDLTVRRRPWVSSRRPAKACSWMHGW